MLYDENDDMALNHLCMQIIEIAFWNTKFLSGFLVEGNN